MQLVEKNPRPPKAGTASAAETAKRQYHRKSRFGCSSCKKRRIKCDEAKPACKRCIDSGVSCTGYFSVPAADTQPQSTKKELLPLIPAVAKRLSVICPPSQLEGSSDEDKRTFRFFCSETGPMLSGYFDADFWNHFLIQFSHHSPAIWHSVLALSAFHEQRLLSEDPTRGNVDFFHRRYALQQYNQAIDHLTGRVSTGKATTEIVLMCCLLFINIETLLGNIPGALIHVCGGIQIVRSWKQDRANTASSRLSPKFIENNLIPIFDQLNQLTFSHGRAAPPILEVEIGLGEPENEWFAGILEARASLLRVVSCAQQFIVTFGACDTGQNIAQRHAEVFQKHRLLFRIQRWEAALNALLARPNMAHLSRGDKRAVAFLRLQYNLVWIAISNFKNTSETSFDGYLANFEAIVDLAESSIDTECGTSWSRHWANSSCQRQNIPPLFLTATKCRNPTIRHKALPLLKNSLTGDRSWRGGHMISLAERVVELEEEGLEDVTDLKGDVVPSEWARIYETGIEPVTVDGHRVDLVTFKRKGSENDKRWREKKEYIGGPNISWAEVLDRLVTSESPEPVTEAEDLKASSESL
ncbi:hypothetical protein L207DRAFT_524776 [Hyaloscypha variabilis F]|uniref:Zn(2)-C6 fungal-type domain-containing protein n=1 Tax=Hyaloscypha variabilis (strain UAMH 11265 / GT02V1 / F) TaxID=1149755 RepID=A0A2J6S3T3_HYAVF|nr:hypothetical protein L207DRAFT_524776 [Hyaloscypha variabilis F]